MNKFLRLAVGFGLLAGGGCAKPQQLLLLKGLSTEASVIEAAHQQQAENFERMLVAMKSEAWAGYTRTEEFSRVFGPPIFKRPVPDTDHALTQWLYRHPTKFFQGPKVYLYFNRQEELEKVEYEPGG